MAFGRFLRRSERDRELRDEIESYVQIGTDENIARGMSYKDASAAARRKFGNPTFIREEIYRMNTVTFFDTLIRDIRYGLRMLRRNPLFTSVALITLAIGIGANTAVFSVVNSVLLKPLPYPDSERLVAVSHSAPGAAGLTEVSGGLRLSPSMYFTYAEQNRTFGSMGVWIPGANTVTGVGEPERVNTIVISDGVLQALGVAPILGRWLSQADQKPGAAAAVMLSYGYWERRFGGDRSVIGRTIRVDSRPLEIVGIMPQRFRFIDTDFDLITPFAFNRANVLLPGFFLDCVARLKPGATIAGASADIARLVPVWMSSWPAAPGIDWRVYEAWRIAPAIRPLKQEVVGSVGNVLWILMGTIGTVMLIACANVANLLLVRAEARRQELAVRAAMGAGWARIVRELLLESTLLGVIGGGLGLGVAAAGLRLLVRIGPGNLPRLNEIGLDARALGFALALSILSGFLFGSLPAVKFGGPGIAPILRGGGRTLSQSRERHRSRNVLVIAQVALALVLVVSAVLMIRTFQAMRRVQPGFSRPEQIETFRTFIPDSLVADPERAARMQNDILDKLAAMPGVKSVAFANSMSMDGLPPDWDGIGPEGKTFTADDTPPMRTFKGVSPGLFGTMGTRLIAGRDYTWTDLYNRRGFVIVSENLARELWGSPAAALGKRIRTVLPSAPLKEVIGVVEDVRESGLQKPPPAIVYWPSYGENNYVADTPLIYRAITFAIRSDRAGTESLRNEMAQALRSVNGSLGMSWVRTMREVESESMARTSFTLVMLGIAGTMALLLGIVGIYGVIAYSVSQRSREIGIRSALGAQPGEIKAMFIRYALILAGIGVAIGLSAAAGLTRLMKSLLFGISPLDPVTYTAVPVLLMAAAALASYLPARRAAAVDPVETLRAE
ncbi:MAG TPA: ABC transporter permease [Bryobacteraceae bacterium]|nr:ABC transporter permease [Bryobacteraceae bacterium]